MNKIIYLKGDVRYPEVKGNKIIAHCCNDLGVMGAGVAKALFVKWSNVKTEYIELNLKDGLDLGTVQFVRVESDIVIANMIGQHGVQIENDIPPIRYKAMRSALQVVGDKAIEIGATVHIPYLMGSALAGGDWNKIESIVESTICERGIEVTAYDIN